MIVGNVDESRLMRLAGFLGMQKLKWSLRRLYVPIWRNALVLEVGSGGNPYPRANILLDAYEETRERHWDPLVHDRLTVMAFGEKLPFKDKCFDFVIAAHVLEHSSEPAKFLAELQRVAHAGYIETPDAFMERINPYTDHRLEVTMRDNSLVIRKKYAHIVDRELVELYEDRAKSSVTRRLIPKNPFDFHVRYYWKDKINFKILNPNVDASWEPMKSDKTNIQSEGFRRMMRFYLLKIIRILFSQNRRNDKINLLSLIICPACQQNELKRDSNWIECRGCGARYEVHDRIFIMQTPFRNNDTL